LGIQVPERADYIRVVISELERIHSHMLALGVLGWEIGMDTLFHYMFRDRELVMESQELLTGGRVHFSANVIGGVRRDINAGQAKAVEDKLQHVGERINHYMDVFRNDASVKNRIRHIGYLSRKKAKELNPVGPNIRASGIDYDVRETGYFAYKDLKFKAITGEGGDIMERSIVRLKECLQSIKLIQDSIVKMPEGDIALKVPPMVNIKEGMETVSRVEAPRGELHYYIKSAGDKPYRVKIRTPTYQTFHIIGEILGGYTIADVPPILASIDPCFSCTDRVTVVDLNSRKERILTKNQIRMGGGHA
jgi:Ni,Fe-hydrogenase III large subunit